ncbi:MAG: RidA family protein, partial [Candidatus Freyarchaeota archaeon]
MEVEKRLKELGIELPKPPKPVGVYIGAKKAGAFVYVSGQGPGAEFKRGKIGKDLTLEEGYEAAKRCAINCLAQLKAVIGDLDKVASIVRVTGYINSADGFTQQPAVLNGFTELLVKVFGDEVGRPTRAAIAVSVEGWLPVEADMIVKLK